MKQKLIMLKQRLEQKGMDFEYNEIPFTQNNFKLSGVLYNSWDLERAIKNTLNSYGKIDYDKIYMLDSKYMVLNYNCLQEVVKAFEGDKENYIKNTYDCVNFSIDAYDFVTDFLKKESAIKGYGVAFAFMGFYYKQFTDKRGHAVNFCPVMRKGNLEFLIFEPQTGELFGLNYFSKYNNIEFGLLFMG